MNNKLKDLIEDIQCLKVLQQERNLMISIMNEVKNPEDFSHYQDQCFKRRQRFLFPIMESCKHMRETMIRDSTTDQLMSDYLHALCDYARYDPSCNTEFLWDEFIF